MVELDQRFEFAQMMSAAERMSGRLGETVQLAVRFEAVVDDDAPFEAFGHLAALVAGAVEREGLGGRGMQPLRPAADAQAGLVEATHTRGADERANPASDRASAAARRRGHSATLAAQSPRAPMRSASASAVRSSEINCCAWR